MKFDIDPDIAKAKTIHTDFYLSAACFEEAKEKIFASTWQFIGDTDQVKEVGWTTPINLLEEYLNEPIVITRDENKTIHCLSNVCTHRGNILVERDCKLNDIRCRYHGRRFKLDGTFLSMPEFKEVENFPSQDDHLKRMPTHQLGKWLFTSLNDKSKPDHFFTDMQNRIGWMPLDQFNFRPDLSKDYLVDAHWALYCENYLEGFHIPFIHAGLNSIIDYGNYTTELFKYSNLQLALAKDGDITFDLPENSPDYGKQVAAYYFWVFPNMMFNFYPWGLSINIIRPLSIDQTKVSFLSYVWDENKLRQGAGSNLDEVEKEDEAIVHQVQKGIRSRFYQHGRYSVKREMGTHHFHRLIAEFMQ
jgi:choline monooxygenase